MSMSEFDEQLNNESNDLLSLAALEQEVPPDFGEDDLVFVHELNSIFSPEQEELPPYFVQTLLASEDQLFRSVEPGFEHRTRARVFRRLKLRRRLFHAPRSAFDAFITGLSNIYARGSLLVSVVALTLIMLVTVAFTAPSFAAGMAVLLHGSRGGVYQVSTYPKGVRSFPHQHGSSHHNASNQPEQIPLLAAQQQLHFKIYWPQSQSLPHNYTLVSINLYRTAEQPWFNGSIIDLVYSLSGGKPKGTGQIVIREFMPSEEVLQVVKDKAVHIVEADKYGQPTAIYVDGQWVGPYVGPYVPTWSYGKRSELIYQQNGVVFWIAGDQHDGIGQKALLNIAHSLRTIPYNHFMYMSGDTEFVTQTDLYNKTFDTFRQDLIRVDADNSSTNAYYVGVDNLIPPIGTHGH